MGYNYDTERKHLFSEDGMEVLLPIRDRVKSLLRTAGAFTVNKAMEGLSGSSWTMLAALDYLVSIGELKELIKTETSFQIYTGSDYPPGR